MLDLPAGTVTFRFTDIEGSTQLLYRAEGRRLPLADAIYYALALGERSNSAA